MKYLFYYDETEHSRVINQKTISANNFYDNFITVIVGWNSANERKIEERYKAFEDKYEEIGETEAMEEFINGNALFLMNQSTIVYYLMDKMGESSLSLMAFPSCNTKYDEEYDKFFQTKEADVLYSSKNPAKSYIMKSEYKRRFIRVSVGFAVFALLASVAEFTAFIYLGMI